MYVTEMVQLSCLMRVVLGGMPDFRRLPQTRRVSLRIREQPYRELWKCFGEVVQAVPSSQWREKSMHCREDGMFQMVEARKQHDHQSHR
jgi:hypothetical protein